MPDTLLTLHNAAVGYGDKPLIKDIDLVLRPGERIALLGPNGAGKSTLIKLMAGELTTMAGSRIEGKGLRIGYFAQHQLEALRPEESPLWHMSHLDPKTREQELRNFLGGFDFRGDMVTAPCGSFSGGEKSRLALALLIWQRPNLLLLDEPTNHLDLEMREALTLALQETDATVVLVSHDRHLLRTTADSLYLVADEGCTLFDGDLDDYANWLATSRKSATKPETVKTKSKIKNDKSRQGNQADLRPLTKEAEKLEKQLALWHAEKTQLDARLAEPELYNDPNPSLLQQLQKRQSELMVDIETTELRWLEIHEQLEA